MKKKFFKTFGFYILACIGLFWFTETVRNILHNNIEGGTFKIVFVCSGLLVVSGLLFTPFILSVRDMLRQWKEEFSDYSYLSILRKKAVQYSNTIKNDVFQNARVVIKDTNAQESLISRFRKDYNHFFHEQGKGVQENHPLQNTATQVYWNVLSLQKRRLDKLDIDMELKAQRMNYGIEGNSVTGELTFDGKYEISDVKEMISADRVFYIGNKKIASFKNKEVAQYQMLNAKKVGGNKIVCPNCGAVTTRENLIDGCDYCHQKFIIEDLGMRVSDFGLYPDADVEYLKYKEAKRKYGLRVALISMLPILIFTIYTTIPQVLSSPTYEGFIYDLGLFLMFISLRTLFLIGILEGLFFLTIFPILQGKASFLHLSKSGLQKLKSSEKNNQNIAEQIRSYDPLFSLGEFYSSLQNKLSVFYYADDVRKMSAFTEGTDVLLNLAEFPQKHSNVVNIDLANVSLLQYSLHQGLQRIDVKAELMLLIVKGNKIKKKKESLTMQLVKSADCKTESVCSPSLMVCKKCGASHSIMEGRYCEYCGNERKLSDYDWAISMCR